MFTETFSQTSTIHPGIFLGQAPWEDSVSPRKNIIASRDQFKPIRIGENLVVNYNCPQCLSEENILMDSILRENFSLDKRAFSKKKIWKINWSAFTVGFVCFLSKFYIWLSRLSSKKVKNNSIWYLNRHTEENLVVNNKDNGAFLPQN